MGWWVGVWGAARIWLDRDMYYVHTCCFALACSVTISNVN